MTTWHPLRNGSNDIQTGFKISQRHKPDETLLWKKNSPSHSTKNHAKFVHPEFVRPLQESAKTKVLAAGKKVAATIRFYSLLRLVLSFGIPSTCFLVILIFQANPVVFQISFRWCLEGLGHSKQMTSNKKLSQTSLTSLRLEWQLRCIFCQDMGAQRQDLNKVPSNSSLHIELHLRRKSEMTEMTIRWDRLRLPKSLVYTVLMLSLRHFW